MKVRLLIAACLAFVTGAALAQQAPTPDAPATKEDILKLFDVMHNRDEVQKILEQVVQQMQTMNREQMKKRNPSISNEELARMDRDSQEIFKNFPIDEMMNDMIPVYARHLTKSDVDAMISFYSSPTGQKLLREMPTIMSESIQAAYPHMQARLDEILKRMDERNSPGTHKKAPVNRPPVQKD